ncbi:MAG: hypothetical protein E6G70_29920 [Alphaproteobacteria bacterium]|nr:MAG: hypothetical protein E6G70_29920 [Alphaproteobacteria bacterium]
MAKRTPSSIASFEDRLAKEAAQWRARAQSLPPGQERNDLLCRAQQCEIAAKINAWVTSPGLQPPAEILPSLLGKSPR